MQGITGSLLHSVFTLLYFIRIWKALLAPYFLRFLSDFIWREYARHSLAPYFLTFLSRDSICWEYARHSLAPYFLVFLSDFIWGEYARNSLAPYFWRFLSDSIWWEYARHSMAPYFLRFFILLYFSDETMKGITGCLLLKVFIRLYLLRICKAFTGSLFNSC